MNQIQFRFFLLIFLIGAETTSAQVIEYVDTVERSFISFDVNPTLYLKTSEINSWYNPGFKLNGHIGLRYGLGIPDKQHATIGVTVSQTFIKNSPYAILYPFQGNSIPYYQLRNTAVTKLGFDLAIGRYFGAKYQHVAELYVGVGVSFVHHNSDFFDSTLVVVERQIKYKPFAMTVLKPVLSFLVADNLHLQLNVSFDVEGADFKKPLFDSSGAPIPSASMDLSPAAIQNFIYMSFGVGIVSS